MDTETKVLQAALLRSKALVESDYHTLEYLHTANFVYTNSSGVLLDKEDYLETYANSGDMRWEAQELEEVQIQTYGQAAVLTAIVHDRASFEGQRFDARFRTTQTWVKTETGWKCVAAQSTNMPT